MGTKKAFRQIKKFPRWVYYPIVFFLKLWHLTLRTRVEGEYSRDPRVMLLWHNRLLFCSFLFSRKERKRTCAMISPSRDGQYIADIVSVLGLETIRGSSSKKGGRALISALKAIRGGNHICITPDGPRGPLYHLNKGAILLASKTGTPIVPFAINSSSYWELKSWDKFQLPKPFSKVTLVLGKEIVIPPDLNDDEFETYRQKVEDEMRKISID